MLLYPILTPTYVTVDAQGNHELWLGRRPVFNGLVWNRPVAQQSSIKLSQKMSSNQLTIAKSPRRVRFRITENKSDFYIYRASKDSDSLNICNKLVVIHKMLPMGGHNLTMEFVTPFGHDGVNLKDMLWPINSSERAVDAAIAKFKRDGTYISPLAPKELILYCEQHDIDYTLNRRTNGYLLEVHENVRNRRV